MPPIGPLRKDDGPACRVCGCTENNACCYIPPTGTARSIACSWVPVTDAPAHLCSACAGTVQDAHEVAKRLLDRYPAVGSPKKKKPLPREYFVVALAGLEHRLKNRLQA